jgi:MFS family permease
VNQTSVIGSVFNRARGASAVGEEASPDPALVEAPVQPRRRKLPGRLSRPIGINVQVHTLDSLRYRNFRYMWAMTMGTGAFNWTLSVVIGWMTFDITRSALLTSLALAMSSVPFLVIGPLAGVLVDRWDRRHVLVAAIAAKAVITAIFAAIVMTGYLQTWHIFAFLLLIGTAIVLVHPAMLSLISNIVPKETLVNAYALNSMGFNAVRLSVPALAGVSIVLLGAAETLFLGVAALLTSALAIRAVKLEPGQNERRVERQNPLAQVAEAVRYVKSERVVMSLIALGVVPGVLLLPFVHGLMPVYAGEVFNVGPAGLGILVSAPGIGSLLGSIMLASARALPRGRVIVLALVWAVICAASFSLSRSMGMSLVLLMMLSSGLATFYTVNGATVQQMVPDSLRGRVASLGAMAHGLYPVGALVAGTVAELFSAPTATLAAAGVMAVIVAISFGPIRRVWSHK